MITADNTVIYSTSFGDTMHLVGNNSSMQPTPLWSVGKSTFLHDLYLSTLFSVHATYFCYEMLY